VTTSWSIPNSPPDGPQVQQLAGRLSFEAATGESNWGQNSQGSVHHAPCRSHLIGHFPVVLAHRMCVVSDLCLYDAIASRSRRLRYLRGGVKTQVSSLIAIDSIPSAPTRCELFGESPRKFFKSWLRALPTHVRGDRTGLRHAGLSDCR
jgi:hypothetical protein